MGCRKEPNQQDASAPRDPIHWTTHMKSECYRILARVLLIKDGSMTTKASKHAKTAQLLSQYCVDTLGMTQYRDNPLTEKQITDKMDSVKKRISKLFKNGAYQKKGETGREGSTLKSKLQNLRSIFNMYWGPMD